MSLFCNTESRCLNFTELFPVALNKRIAVVKMNKKDLCPILCRQTAQQRHSFRNERMRNLAQWPADLAIGIESAVQQKKIAVLNKVRKARIPLLPFIDVWNKDKRFRPRTDLESNSFGDCVKLQHFSFLARRAITGFINRNHIRYTHR